MMRAPWDRRRGGLGRGCSFLLLRLEFLELFPCAFEAFSRLLCQFNGPFDLALLVDVIGHEPLYLLLIVLVLERFIRGQREGLLSRQGAL